MISTKVLSLMASWASPPPPAPPKKKKKEKKNSREHN